jgi:sn-glycerol 3-phosphate transport system ATP-binding protein
MVEAVELLGAERLVYCKMGADALIVRIQEDQVAPKIGSVIFLKPRADRMHYFDAESGKRK